MSLGEGAGAHSEHAAMGRGSALRARVHPRNQHVESR